MNVNVYVDSKELAEKVYPYVQFLDNTTRWVESIVEGVEYDDSHQMLELEASIINVFGKKPGMPKAELAHKHYNLLMTEIPYLITHISEVNPNIRYKVSITDIYELLANDTLFLNLNIVPYKPDTTFVVNRDMMPKTTETLTLEKVDIFHLVITSKNTHEVFHNTFQSTPGMAGGLLDDNLLMLINMNFDALNIVEHRSSYN